MDWPIGLPRRAAVLANVYDAVAAWRNAPKKSQWTDNNPDAWNIVSGIIKRRKEIAKEANG